MKENQEIKQNELEQELLNSEELNELEGGVNSLVESGAIVKQGFSHCCNGGVASETFD